MDVHIPGGSDILGRYSTVTCIAHGDAQQVEVPWYCKARLRHVYTAEDVTSKCGKSIKPASLPPEAAHDVLK